MGIVREEIVRAEEIVAVEDVPEAVVAAVVVAVAVVRVGAVVGAAADEVPAAGTVGPATKRSGSDLHGMKGEGRRDKSRGPFSFRLARLSTAHLDVEDAEQNLLTGPLSDMSSGANRVRPFMYFAGRDFRSYSSLTKSKNG